MMHCSPHGGLGIGIVKRPERRAIASLQRLIADPFHIGRAKSLKRQSCRNLAKTHTSTVGQTIVFT